MFCVGNTFVSNTFVSNTFITYICWQKASYGNAFCLWKARR